MQCFSFQIYYMIVYEMWVEFSAVSKREMWTTIQKYICFFFFLSDEEEEEDESGEEAEDPALESLSAAIKYQVNSASSH